MRSYTSIALGFIVAISLAASAAAKDYPIQLKVLSAESHEDIGPSQRALEGCSWRDLDAYCFGSSPYIVNTMVVQENGGEPFSIACTAYEWSNCTDLAVDQTFQARKEKHGIAILYTDKSGTKRTQVYEIERSSDQSARFSGQGRE